MPLLILGFALVTFAVVSVWDAARITSTLRMPGAFDLVGPDRYLLGVSILIGGLGAGLLLQAVGEMKKARAVASTDSKQEPESNRHILLIGLVLLYALVMPVTGYLVATFLFVFATFKVMGMQDWRWIFTSAVATTVGFYLAFVKLADMSLPRGLWEFG